MPRPLPLSLALGAALALALAARTVHRPHRHTVFPVLAGAADRWWQDAPLYDDYRPLDYFRYPPTFAIGFTPLARLGPRPGGVAWAWLSLGVYVFGLRRAARDVFPGVWTEHREAAFLLLAVVGALPGLWNGQSNALLAGVLLLGASALVRERWWAAAVLLALPAAVKLMPLPLTLLCCALWPRRLAGRCFVVLAAGLLAPFLTRPPAAVCEQYRGWAGHLVEMSAERWPGFRDGWTLWLVTRHLAAGKGGVPDLRAPLDADWYRALQAAGGLAVLAACLALRRKGPPRGELVTVTLALGSAWLMLLGPAVEAPTYAFLAPFLAWAVVQPGAWPGGVTLARAAAVLVFVLGWGTLTRPLWGAVPLLAAALPLGSGLFLAWAAGLCLRPPAPVRC